jgi:hypothetical protein
MLASPFSCSARNPRFGHHGSDDIGVSSSCPFYGHIFGSVNFNLYETLIYILGSKFYQGWSYWEHLCGQQLPIRWECVRASPIELLDTAAGYYFGALVKMLLSLLFTRSLSMLSWSYIRAYGKALGNSHSFSSSSDSSNSVHLLILQLSHKENKDMIISSWNETP